MKKELDEALVRDFPNLYADRNGDIMATAMTWGFECRDGWEPLIREASEELEKLIVKYKADNPDLEWYPRASQVKEKYGSLRLYMTSETDEMSKVIRIAEEKSSVTCEICGKPGELRGEYWVTTLCDEHTKKEEKQYERLNAIRTNRCCYGSHSSSWLAHEWHARD